jgi:hypothetical protein
MFSSSIMLQQPHRIPDLPDRRRPAGNRLVWLLVFCVILFHESGYGHSAVPADAPSAAAFAGRIRDYHAGATENGERLRVVYFYPCDVSLPQDFRERLSRILLDIQDFYLAEMKRNGFADSVMPLEQENGAITIHTVQGEKPANAYSYDYAHGKAIRREIEKSLAGTIDFGSDFVLIICNLCTERPDGSFFFNSPYYGGPGADHRAGHCFVADCPKQDPLLLTDTENHIDYEEHYGKYRQTLAHFNTKYLGGIAHELGHGLGLSHRSQTRQEAERLGTALMGSGNHTYRRERWDADKKGSFLTFSACVQLAAHPLFTQSDRGREVEPKLTVTDLKFAANGRQLIIEGTVKSDPEVFAVVVFSDPEEQANSTKAWTDYDAITSVAEVRNGRFTAVVNEHPSRFYKLRLDFCHLNGAVSDRRFQYQADDSGTPDAAALNAQWEREKAPPALLEEAEQAGS